MKKRLNLTIDAEVCDALENLPRKVSVSEIVNVFLRLMMMEMQKGRELTNEEFDAEIERAGGEEFRKRVGSVLGPTVDRIDSGLGKIKDFFALTGVQKPEGVGK